MSLYYYIYYALSHILQRRWRITPNILLLLFCCYFFVTGIPQTLTSYCGCRFCGYFVFFLFIAQGRLIVCACVFCVYELNVLYVPCICMRVQCYVISVAVLLLFFSFPRLFLRRARKLELGFLSLYGNRNFGKSAKLLLRWENAFEGINHK